MNIKTAAVFAAILSLGLTLAGTASANAQPYAIHHPIVTKAVAFDVSRPVRSLPVVSPGSVRMDREVHEYDGPFPRNVPDFRDPIVQRTMGVQPNAGPILTFEGINNINFVLPPDPDGAIGVNNFVEMVNLSFAVYDRLGNLLAGPTSIGSLFSGFSVSDCALNAGDPVVLYDRRNDRWILTQFTSRGPNFWNCVAVSQTSDPAGAYYRYAFAAGPYFPDYPKYGDWSDSYILTSRDFASDNTFHGISVYGLEKKKMIAGNPNARNVHFLLDPAVVPLATIGDGLLPADVDGKNYPAAGAPAPIVGTQDDDGPYGATFDALNIYDLTVLWSNPNASTLTGPTQIATAPFNSTFPCGSGRACIPQPGTTAKIDFLGYRQRPTFRLSYRKKVGYEDLVTNQSVQASPGVAGVRWYEIRRTAGVYSLFQQGTYAPADGVNRWMGSVATDKRGDIGLGFSVSDGTSTYPGIRFTGRKVGDPLGTMTLREQVIQAGTGAQLSSAARWGDYTALSIDPVDDCTFWYVNEYIQTTGSAPWRTRIGTFKIRGCR